MVCIANVTCSYRLHTERIHNLNNWKGRDSRMDYFEKCSPESQGIESQGIIRMLEGFQERGLEIHSVMIVRNEKCCATGWWKPYESEYPHSLYSFSKTLTSIAIGFAVQEGKLRLDEKLTDLFADEISFEPSENMKKATVCHLLTMSCGHATDFEDFSEDWVENFLKREFVYEPGSTFIYNTGGTNMLAAILKKKTGQNITEFLYHRFLEPLGITHLSCIVLPDKNHVELAGGGMHLTTEEMAKVSLFLLNKGAWEGRQLLSRKWFDQACARLVETNHVFADRMESSNGYGYQIWQGSRQGSYRAEGAFGQFGLVYPDLNLVISLTAAVAQFRVQEIFDVINWEFLPAVCDKVLPECGNSAVLENMLKNLSIPVMRGDRNPFMEKKLENKVFLTTAADKEQGCSSLEILIGGGTLYPLTEGEITRMSFSFEEKLLKWKVWENGKVMELAAAMEGSFEKTKLDGKIYGATARWRSVNSLEIEARRLDSLSGARIIFRFQELLLELTADDTLVEVGGASNYPRRTAKFRME